MATVRRKRHVGPKVYRTCRACGAPYPAKYECGCSQSTLIQRVFDLFPGVVEIDENEMRLLQRERSYKRDDCTDDLPF